MSMTATTDIGFDVRVSDSPLPAGERARILAAPAFGEVFTDHMITIRWADGRGWHDARLEPYGPLTLDPATAVLHYAQEIFEGLKAYRTAGRVDRGVPPARQCGQVQPVGGADGHAGASARYLSSTPSSFWSPRTGTGCPPPRNTVCTCGRS